MKDRKAFIQFKNFLRKHKCLNAFRRALHTNYYPTTIEIIIDNKTTIAGAFVWMRTKEGANYWRHIYRLHSLKL